MILKSYLKDPYKMHRLSVITDLSILILLILSSDLVSCLLESMFLFLLLFNKSFLPHLVTDHMSDFGG